jgi:TonB family protein
MVVEVAMATFRAWRLCLSHVAASLLLFFLATFATAQDSPQAPVRVPDDAAQNLLIRKVSPLYPPLARQARIQGTVILKIVISKSGNVQSLQLVKGHPMLAPAAFEAVRQWKYQPSLSTGERVEVETNVQVNFVLAPQPMSK